MGKGTEAKLQAMAKKIRETIIEMTYHAGTAGAHVGGALSCADLLAVLYGDVMKIDAQNPFLENRDRFILSKGHSSVGHYAALYAAGFLSAEDIQSFESNGGAFPAHSVKNVEHGIELSSGSLGLGLSFGIGEALAARKKGLDYKVYVLLGNGECNEGSVWEAVMLAAQLKLENLYMIIDDNGQQLDGISESILRIPNLYETLQSMGFETNSVDGHSIGNLLHAFTSSGKQNKPVAIIMNTIKGKGVSFMENNPMWHHARLQTEEYERAMEEIGRDD
ncbi:MAG: transketolase [Lachnospiraceae bacterium]|nr:transketolase [Lachnospiraceae bacterium]